VERATGRKFCLNRAVLVQGFERLLQFLHLLLQRFAL
jgi:hypothetical protein